MKSDLTLSTLIVAVKAAQRAEAAGDLALRNKLAEELFFSARRRNVSIPGYGRVETRWDWQSRNYFTTRIDDQGNQIGDADCAGEAVGAAIQHFWALAKILPKIEAAAEAEFIAKAFGGRTRGFVDRNGQPV